MVPSAVMSQYSLLATYLSVIRVRTDGVLQLLTIGVAVKVCSRELLLGGRPLIDLGRLRVLEPFVRVRHAYFPVPLALIDVDVVRTACLWVLVGCPASRSTHHAQS